MRCWLKDAVSEARLTAKEESRGFFRQVAAQMDYGSQFAARYGAMQVDDILRLHPDNFCIAVDQIRRYLCGWAMLPRTGRSR